MAAGLRGLVVGAAVGWIAAVGLTIVRMLPGESPEWVGPILTLMLAVGATSTLTAVVLAALPPVFDAWESGVRYGERAAERAAERVPSQRRHLSSVR